VERLSSPSLIRIMTRRTMSAGRRAAAVDGLAGFRKHRRRRRKPAVPPPARGAQNVVAERSGVIRESLEDLRLVIEGHQEGFVLLGPQHAKQEVVGGVLLEF